ncbi:MAG: SCO family protein [Planctomycetota bacterium]
MEPCPTNPTREAPGPAAERRALRRWAALGGVVALGLSLVGGSAVGQSRVGPNPLGGGNAPLPPAAAEIQTNGIIQKLGNTLPLDTKLVDQAGRPVTLGDYFNQDKPVIIEFAYFDCPMLCPMVMSGIADAAKAVGDDWRPGENYDILTISINPDDKPTGAMLQQDRAFDEVGGEAGLGREVRAGWHFLTGREVDVRRIADAVGFGYNRIEETNDFAHVAVITFASPDGVVTRYLPSHVYPAKDFRLALTEASQGKQGSFFDMVLQLCYRYDHTLGQYTVHALTLMKLAGAVTVVALASIIGGLFYFERRRKTRLTGGNDRDQGSSGDNKPGRPSLA